MKQFIALILFCFLGKFSFAQHYVLDSIKPSLGHLINFEANKFEYAENSPFFDKFFKKMSNIYQGKQEKLHIFHIGGSHIQADIYSNKVRTYLQNANAASMGQRGFVVPFHLAHTNNPTNYRIEANKELWKGYRCSIRKDSVAWGLAGVTAAFRDKVDTIYIKSNHKNYTNYPYCFDRLRIFYNTWKNDYHLKPLDSTITYTNRVDPDKMYVEYQFPYEIDSVAFQIKLKDTTTIDPEFLFMGAEYMNNGPGIEYTSIGVNGASFEWYKRCAFFERQLSLYKPDMFIISIGTNDAYMPPSKFDADRFRDNYESFIEMIKRINPDCAILLTVPNDDYYRKRNPNPNTALQKKIIKQLAQKYRMAVWDFYTIMGGFGSSNEWFKNELMPKDRIHFTYLGYEIKADLFLNAFIKAWSEITDESYDTLINHYTSLDE